MSEHYVGVDVSKEYLDVASSDGEKLRVGNDEAGHQELVNGCAAPPALVLMEATGGLERALAV